MISSIPSLSDPVQNNVAQVTKKNSTHQILFKKIILKANQKPPKGLRIRGCLAISRDQNREGWMHVLFWIAQKIHRCLFGDPNDDINLCHGMITLKKNRIKRKEGHFIVAHSQFDGIHTSSRNYLEEKDVTELIIYRPIHKKLRKSIIKHTYQTCHVPDKHRKKTEKKVTKASFSVFDMVASFFKRLYDYPNEDGMQHTAKIVTDLLMNKQILSDDGNSQEGYFCTPYMTSILQGSILLQALSENDKTSLLYDKDCQAKNREDIILEIIQRIQTHNTDDTLSDTYWSNRICQVDPRFLMSYQAGSLLDTMSC